MPQPSCSKAMARPNGTGKAGRGRPVEKRQRLEVRVNGRKQGSMIRVLQCYETSVRRLHLQDAIQSSLPRFFGFTWLFVLVGGYACAFYRTNGAIASASKRPWKKDSATRTDERVITTDPYSIHWFQMQVGAEGEEPGGGQKQRTGSHVSGRGENCAGGPDDRSSQKYLGDDETCEKHRWPPEKALSRFVSRDTVAEPCDRTRHR